MNFKRGVRLTIPLDAQTVRLMARKFSGVERSVPELSEFPELSDASIVQFVKIAESLDAAPTSVRGNALGIAQANLGMWQILARQGQIPKAQIDNSWQKVIQPFGHVRSSAQAYDAGRASLEELFRATTGKPTTSQDEIIELLAGPQQATPDGQTMHHEVATKIRTVLEGQRLVSLDTVLLMGDGLHQKAKGRSPWTNG